MYCAFAFEKSLDRRFTRSVIREATIDLSLQPEICSLAGATVGDVAIVAVIVYA